MDFVLILIGRFSPKGKCESGHGPGPGCASRSQCSIRSSIVLPELAGQGIPPVTLAGAKAVGRLRAYAAELGYTLCRPRDSSRNSLSVPQYGRNNLQRLPQPPPHRSRRGRCLHACLPRGVFLPHADSRWAIAAWPARSLFTVFRPQSILGEVRVRRPALQPVRRPAVQSLPMSLRPGLKSLPARPPVPPGLRSVLPQ